MSIIIKRPSNVHDFCDKTCILLTLSANTYKDFITEKINKSHKTANKFVTKNINAHCYELVRKLGAANSSEPYTSQPLYVRRQGRSFSLSFQSQLSALLPTT